MSQTVYPVCVIGGGAAGVMATLRTVLNNDTCLFFPGTPKDKKKSRALWVRKVENMPSHLQYKRGIEDPNLETLNWLAQSDFKEKLIWKKNVGVTHIEKLTNGHFKITTSKDEIFEAKFVILCTGVMDVQPIIQGEIDPIFDYANAQTADYCLICDGHHVLNKRVAVIGHDNGAAWIAIMLHERYGSQITILTNGQKPQYQKETSDLLVQYRVQTILPPILSINGEEKGKVLHSFTLEDQQVVEADICFVALGMIVYNDLAKMVHAQIDERGFVIADESGQSSIEGLYVAGDLRAKTRKQIYTSWDTAVTAATSINQKLRASKRPI